MAEVTVDGRTISLTNLDKEYWPGSYVKADLIDYYVRVGDYALACLKGRPVVMNRFPDGIAGKNFYQKNRPEHAPEWMRTVRVGHSERTIDYLVYENRATLVWLANQGCIEMHAWLARADRLDHPDLAVLDLDPAEGATFRQAVAVGFLARAVLGEFGLAGFPKTSGATGLHVFIPLVPKHTHREVTRAMALIAGLVTDVCGFATTERVIERRAGKVYIDYLQNAAGRSMAFPYSVRPRPGAPVSTPLDWEELECLDDPARFNLRTVPDRLRTHGDPYAGLFVRRYRLDALLALAETSAVGDG